MQVGRWSAPLRWRRVPKAARATSVPPARRATAATPAPSEVSDSVVSKEEAAKRSRSARKRAVAKTQR
eukprot:11212282-Lingulodinium_polyedra.AAC.1